MTAKYITQYFENTDYKPEITQETITVTDPNTFEIVEKTIDKYKPLTAEELATAKSNINYKRAFAASEHLSAIGLSTSVGLDYLTIKVNGNSVLTEIEV